MRCYLRIDSDTLEEAQAYPSIKAAVDVYTATATELAGYGQECVASIHLAITREDLQEYPDFVLSLGPKGGVRRERC